MPTLLFIDGRRHIVDYTTADNIRQVFDRERPPKDDRQRAFVATIQEIIFEPLPKPREYTSTKLPQHDPELHKIINDKKLHGKAKFDAVGEHLRTRGHTT